MNNQETKLRSLPRRPLRADTIAALVVMAAVFTVYAGGHFLHWSRFVLPGWDETWQIPLAWMREQPSLFLKDKFLTALGEWYPPVWTFLLGRLLALAGQDFITLLGAGSVVLLGLFGLGNFLLARRVSGSAWAALVMAVVLLRPHQASYNPYGIMVGNFTANSMGIALTPWLLLGLLAARNKGVRIALLGVAIGITSLINTSVAFHVALLSAACLLWGKGGWKRALWLALPFVPFFLFSSNLVHSGPGDPPDLEIMRFRNAYLLGTWDYVRLLPNTLLLPAILGAYAWTAFWTAKDESRRRLARLGLVTVVFWATTWLGRLIPVWMLALSWRSLSLLFPVLFCAGACALSDSLASRRWGQAAAVLAIWTGCLLWTDLPLVPRSGGGTAASAESGIRACKTEFLELCSWARADTGESELFLVPPDSFAGFRLYGRRGVAVTVKEGTGFYKGSIAREWKSRYDAIRGAYGSGQWAKIHEQAALSRADWVVLEAGAPAPAAAFENRCFRVVDVRGENRGARSLSNIKSGSYVSSFNRAGVN